MIPITALLFLGHLSNSKSKIFIDAAGKLFVLVVIVKYMYELGCVD